jgi:hypothetical protein
MRLAPHETGFDLANLLHLARYRDNAGQAYTEREYRAWLDEAGWLCHGNERRIERGQG